MNFRPKHPKEEIEINLIPFIDILLVIVIFLMVTTTYSRYTALQITLPTAGAEKALEQAYEVNISIDKEGRYAINNSRVSARSAADLAQDLQRAVQMMGANKTEPTIIINADALAMHQTVINALEAARIAGYHKVTFTAQTE